MSSIRAASCRILRARAADEPVGNLRIGLVEQQTECVSAVDVCGGEAQVEPTHEQQVQLLHAAPAAPPQTALHLVRHDYDPRFSSRRLMSAIARAGLRSFGQASMQFMIVWQR